MQLLSSRPIAENVKVWFKKHAWELFQYSSVLLNNRFKLNNDLKELLTKLLNFQAISCTVERSFSMLRKLLANDRHISPDDVSKYLAVYVNKTLE